MKKILTGIAILILLGGSAFLLLRDNTDEPDFRMEKITRGDITAVVTASGTVNPVTTVLVGTQVSGTVKSIFADFNSLVKKGQLIAQIDPAKFEAEVEQARANLMSARANLEKSEAAMLDAKRTMERNRNLFAEQLVSQSVLDTSETNYEASRAQVSASRAQIAQAEAALKISETNLMYTKILSPVDGIVVSRNVDVGQTVAASFQTPTLFTIAQDLTKMQIDASVDEADIGKVKVGQAVEFNVDAYPDIMFRGTVEQIRNSPLIVQNVVTYDVVVGANNPAGTNGDSPLLKPGMTANVSIVMQVKKDILRLPNAALRFSMPATEKAPGQQREKGRGVWTIEGGKPIRVSVKAGISDGTFTELLSEGLKDGQELIVESVKSKDNGKNSAPRPRMF